MLNIKAQLEKLPEADRVHMVRLCRSILNESLLEVLRDDKENPIFKSKLASVLANRIDDLTEYFPEADDSMPMRVEVRYDTDD